MLKKIFRMALAFVVLTAAYTGYSRGFAHLAGHVAARKTVPTLPILEGKSRSEREAGELAVAAFGPGHWAAKAPMRYYDVQRGYWIYWSDQLRLANGKSWEFSPVAIITRSKPGAPLKTITGRKARVDFDRDVSKPSGEAARVVHALIREDVRVRDDKGTADIGDDITVGPMKSLEFDEAKEEIVSEVEERVVLRERGLTASGIGLKLYLRRRDPSGVGPKSGGVGAGFEGVKAISFSRDAEIDVQDVGRSGIVPGGSGKAPQMVVTTAGDGTKTKKAAPRPGHIQCSGEMRIELPKARRPVRVGPPAPPDPTIATFHRNVRVRQGDPLKPEQLDSDDLVATLLPAEKPEAETEKAKAEKEAAARARPAAKGDMAAAKGKAEADPASEPIEGGALSGLVLHRAVANGHAVWLQSEAQGLVALGNQLIFDRRPTDDADRIYLRGDRITEVTKTDYVATGKDKGKPQSISIIRTKDVIVFQHPPGGPPPSVVARGPGTLETRAAGRDEVERFASWQDSLTMVGAAGSEQRRVTFTGRPRLRSAQGDISATREIVADLFPKSKAPAGREASAVVSADGRPVPAEPSASEAAAPGTGDALRIKKLVAKGNVRLVTVATPADPTAKPPRSASPGRDITARDVLTADFAEAPAAEPKPKKTPGSTTDGSPIIERRDVERRDAVASAAPEPPSPPVEPGAEPAPTPRPAPRPAEPAMTAIADTVWALVAQQPGSDKGQVQDAKLTGDVEIHQDPAQGKTRGSDITADAVLLKNGGENRAWVQAFGNPSRPALAVSEDRSIEGQVLTLDQATDHAWVKYGGRLETQQDDTDFLDDSAPTMVQVAEVNADGRPKKAPAKKKGPLVITWGKTPADKDAWMHFYGRPNDADGQPGPAKALFHSHVRAKSDDSALACERLLEVTFDGPVAFVKPKKGEPKASAEEEPQPQVAFLHATGDVDIVARKIDPETGFLKDKKRILDRDVSYDKATGQFFTAGGPGQVLLYTTSKGGDAKSPLAASTPDRRTVRPVTDRVPAQGASGSKAGPPQLSLTHVRYQKKMQGRFAPPDDAKPKDYSTATFLGDVEAVMAKVGDESVEIDSDRPPPDFYRIVSRRLDVQVEPPPAKTPKTSDRVLLDASNGAKAFTRDSAIEGDRITYDSLNELTYVYGGAAGVAIVKQDGAGQPPTAGRGTALFHDHKTGHTKLIDPQTFQIIDPNSGTRSRIAQIAPPPPASRNVPGLTLPSPNLKKRKRSDAIEKSKQIRLPNESDKERKSFSGK